MKKTPEKKAVTAVRAAAAKKAPAQERSFATWHKWLAIAYAVQAAAIVVLSVVKTIPVVSSFLATNTLASEIKGTTVLTTASRHIADINLVALLAAMLLVSAAMHIAIATRYRHQYEADLKKGRNLFRWLTYGAVDAIVLIVVAGLAGIAEASVLIAAAALALITNLLGAAIEWSGNPKDSASTVQWLLFWLGAAAGTVTWVFIALALFGGLAWAGSTAPAYVFWLAGSVFALMTAVAANIFLTLKRRGKWADYLYAEKLHVGIAFILQTVVAWQVFAGVLKP